MNRIEALNILGLDDDATAQDIKTAYKECVQILHPDRFAGNKKLQERATEQFKRLQDAYDFLRTGRGAKAPNGSQEARSRSVSYAEAQLAGLAAARTQLMAQRDAVYDERRNALVMMAAGIIGAIVGRRIIWIAGIAGTLIIWGIVSLISACQNISTINDHLKEIDMQKRQLEEDWEEDR
ncbi:MAG: J domain-containing protein [Slackia sp.]|nr:J domain-containing protein [Slackia sp.]